MVKSLLAVGCIASFTIPSMGLSQSSVAMGPRSATVSTARVTIDVVGQPLEDVLIAIARQAGLRPVLEGKAGQFASRVTVRVRGVPVDEAFSKALAGSGLRAEISEKLVVFVREMMPSRVAQGTITGKVIDARTKQPLHGATVTLSGVQKSVTTGDDGLFRLPAVPSGSYTVQVRLLGYSKAKRGVTVIDGQREVLEIALEPSVNALDQVVVTGTVVSTELRAVPNAMTVITGKQLEERGITNIAQLFRGDVPGLFAVNQGASTALDEVLMFSRGATAINSNSAGTTSRTNPIKTYVDGVEFADPQYLSQIDPTSIDRIEILTGPQASTIYGSNAINGVMQIFTKRAFQARPQLVLSLTSGVVQNNMTSRLAPDYVTDSRLSGVEGRLSYNVGGSWNYAGAWTPAKQTQRISVNGGGRIDFGIVTADISARQGITRNRSREGDALTYSAWQSSGFLLVRGTNFGVPSPIDASLQGRTAGITVSARPLPWWSHEVGIGTDVSETESITPEAGFTRPADTTLRITSRTTSRSSSRYNTTAQLPLASLARLTLAAGWDHWRTSGASMTASPTILTGTLTGVSNVTRVKPDKNSGVFVQGQLGLWESVFLTYGMRADWNPNLGNKAKMLPGRYGISYARDLETPLGPVTAKVRGSYGRSIRPPKVGLKEAIPATAVAALDLFGPYDNYLANPYLVSEFQQGGEGGLELYFGSRVALVVTRYNQTVDNLIVNAVGVDSVRSRRAPVTTTDIGQCSSQFRDDEGYCYKIQGQYVNAGSIRNQGWELQGNVTLGPLTGRGTYSWTKSRLIGVTERYRALASIDGAVPGQTWNFLPEHTWAWGMAYAHAASTVGFSITGTGMYLKGLSPLAYTSQLSVRLTGNRVRMDVDNIKLQAPGYATADLNATHRFSPAIEAQLYVNNLTNHYTTDTGWITPTMGRSIRLGLRVRLP